jgi:rhodanese-related sulfurtransferase
MTYTPILYPQLRELLQHGAQLVEVLPPAEYQELHLPAATSIPAPDKLLVKLERADLTTALLTDPDARLLGIVRRVDLQEPGRRRDGG